MHDSRKFAGITLGSPGIPWDPLESLGIPWDPLGPPGIHRYPPSSDTPRRGCPLVASVAMSKLMQGAAQHAKSAPKGAPRKVHQGAAQNKSKSAQGAEMFTKKALQKAHTWLLVF